MKPVTHILLAVVVGVGSRPALQAQTWESKMISSGANRPLLQIGRSPWSEGLIALRAGGSPPSDSVVEALINEGVARRLADGIVPTCMIASLQDGQALGSHAATFGRVILPKLLSHIDHLGDSISRDPELAGIPQADLALMLYSNVLLDNWQINGVETEWLAVERPARAGGRYYCAAFERGDSSRLEPFGIWGNASRSADGWRIGVYGNDRRNIGLHNVSGTELALELGIDTAGTPPAQRLGRAIDLLAGWHRSGSADQRFVRAAKRFGFWHNGRSTLLVLRSMVSARFTELAVAFRPTLVALLQGADSSLSELQQSSGYHALAPAEFRIWWYHFLYTALTRELVASGIIPQDQSHRVTYLIRDPAG